MRRAVKAGLLKRLLRDRRGVSAIEFALIAPVMITIYFNMSFEIIFKSADLFWIFIVHIFNNTHKHTWNKVLSPKSKNGC